MKYTLRQTTGIFAFCSVFAATSMTSFAGTVNHTTAIQHGPGTGTSQYLVKIVGESAVINTDPVNGELLMEAEMDDSFPLMEETAGSCRGRRAGGGSGNSGGYPGRIQERRKHGKPETEGSRLRYAVFGMQLPLWRQQSFNRRRLFRLYQFCYA